MSILDDAVKKYGFLDSRTDKADKSAFDSFVSPQSKESENIEAASVSFVSPQPDVSEKFMSASDTSNCDRIRFPHGIHLADRAGNTHNVFAVTCSRCSGYGCSHCGGYGYLLGDGFHD